MQGPPIKRLYYSSRQICELTGIDMKTLLDWECTFSKIKPVRHKSGKKLYKPNDLEAVLLIKKLKKKKMDNMAIQVVLDPAIVGEIIDQSKIKRPVIQFIPEVKKRLKDILSILDRDSV